MTAGYFEVLICERIEALPDMILIDSEEELPTLSQLPLT